MIDGKTLIGWAFPRSADQPYFEFRADEAQPWVTCDGKDTIVSFSLIGNPR